MTPPLPEITRLHAVFCAITGAELRLGLGEFMRERGWADYLRAGFTEADLRLVIAYLQRQIRCGDRRPGALKWSNLIGDLSRFEEDLQLARAAHRVKAPTAQERVRALRERPINGIQAGANQSNTKSVGELIAALRAAVSAPPL